MPRREELDNSKAILACEEDPRAQGHGPCGTDHENLIRNGNQYASWERCTKCGLRTAYVPAKNAKADRKTEHRPEDIQEALNRLRKLEIWEGMTHKLMRTMLGVVSAEKELKKALEDHQAAVKKKDQHRKESPAEAPTWSMTDASKRRGISPGKTKGASPRT